MVRCPDTWDQRGLVARTGTRSGLSGLRWNQRMGPDGSDPVAMDLCPTGGDRFPSSVRLSPIVTTGKGSGSFAGSRRDGFDDGPTILPLAIYRALAESKVLRDRRKLGRFTAQRLRDRCLRDDVTGRGPRADEDSGAGGEAFVQCHLRGVSCASGGRRSRTRKAGRPRGLNVWFSDGSETRRLSCS